MSHIELSEELCDHGGGEFYLGRCPACGVEDDRDPDEVTRLLPESLVGRGWDQDGSAEEAAYHDAKDGRTQWLT